MPPQQPPATPWIGLPRFQDEDESLLIDAQPIFDDTLNGIDEWAITPKTNHKLGGSAKYRVTVDTSIDLGDYLPEDDEQVHVQSPTIPARIRKVESEHEVGERVETKETGQNAAQSKIETQSDKQVRNVYTHKREGSQSLIPIAGPSKKAKPPVHYEKKDNIPIANPFEGSTNLKTSGNAISSALNASQSQPQSHIPKIVQQPIATKVPQDQSSKLPLSTSTSSIPVKLPTTNRETASSRLKAGLSRGKDQTHLVEKQAKQNSIPGSGRPTQEIDSSTHSHQPAERASALSRYPAKSIVSDPQRQSSAVPFMQNAPTTKPADKEQPSSSPRISATQPINTVGHDTDFTNHRQDAPCSLSSSISETSSIRTTTSSITQDIENVKSSGSRRSSMSEKVVGFFSNLLTRSISSSSLREEYKNKEGADDGSVAGDNTITMDVEDTGANTDEMEDPEEVAIDSPIIAEEETTTVIAEEREKIGRSSTNDAHQNFRQKVSIVPLTKPISFSRQLHKRPERKTVNDTHPKGKHQTSLLTTTQIRPRAPLQPSTSRMTNANSHPPSSSSSSLSTSKSSFNSKVDMKTTQGMTKKPPIPMIKSKTSAFASAALAKLPPPGKGHSTSISNQPIIVKPTERASNLGDRRSVFERLASSASSSGSRDLHHPRPSKLVEGKRNGNLNLTIPIRGHTPGKASTLRSQQRAKFDAIVNEKIKQKEHIEEIKRIEQQQREEEEYQRRRKETVIWAKPVPEMYKK